MNAKPGLGKPTFFRIFGFRWTHIFGNFNSGEPTLLAYFLLLYYRPPQIQTHHWLLVTPAQEDPSAVPVYMSAVGFSTWSVILPLPDSLQSCIRLVSHGDHSGMQLCRLSGRGRMTDHVLDPTPDTHTCTALRSSREGVTGSQGWVWIRGGLW